MAQPTSNKLVALLNPEPSQTPSMLQQSISLQTYDTTDPNRQQTVIESYNITPLNVTLAKTDGYGGTKQVLKLGSTDYALKFHFPYETNLNTFYVTYCKANGTYLGGYRDYISAVPQGFIDAVIAWANTTLSKINFSFTGNGSTSNDMSVVGNFSVTIAYNTNTPSSPSSQSSSS